MRRCVFEEDTADDESICRLDEGYVFVLWAKCEHKCNANPNKCEINEERKVALYAQIGVEVPEDFWVGMEEDRRKQLNNVYNEWKLED